MIPGTMHIYGLGAFNVARPRRSAMAKKWDSDPLKDDHYFSVFFFFSGSFFLGLLQYIYIYIPSGELT